MSNRKHITIAPVSITPTKPLVPSHYKSLIWLDVLIKCLSEVHDVTLLNNRVLSFLNLQTMNFWHYLDHVLPEASYTDKPELWIGKHYVASNSRLVGEGMPEDGFDQYKAKIERDGWMHPSASRLFDIWTGNCAQLNISASLIAKDRPLDLTTDALLTILADMNCILDLREIGGEVYIDFTDEGIPLRKLVDVTGTENYFAGILRSLVPVAEHTDSIYLLCDEQLSADYWILVKILTRLGVHATRVTLGRVPLDGQVQSSRHGGWEQYLFDGFAEPLLQSFPQRAFSLGMRFYFVCVLGQSEGISFSVDRLKVCVQKAERLLDILPPPVSVPELSSFIASKMRPGYLLNPYLMVSELYGKKVSPYAGSLVNLLLS